MRSRLQRAALIVGLAAGALLLAVAGGAVAVRLRLGASLSVLDGAVRLAGLASTVTVERDDLGVPTIRGGSREDVARATGFLHAQERFFQMDLLRRRAAAELAGLFGPALVPEDRRNCVHRFRTLAEQHAAGLDAADRALLEAYVAGVNAGLAALGAPPPEYLVLRADPRPWEPRDTMLVVLAMYMELQEHDGRRESDLGLLAELLPAEAVAFMNPPGTEWDAPIDGAASPVPAVPPASVLDLRREAPASSGAVPAPDAPVPGSNAWLVAGAWTTHGGAILANDLHLPLGLPNIWYRASLAWTAADGEPQRVTGITLPGAPLVVVGTNGHIAWGFTNSQADTADLVLLEDVPGGGSGYRTPDGPRDPERFTERIPVRGGADEVAQVEWTIWGPVLDRDHRGRRRALRWIAHDNDVGLDLRLLEMARGVDEALDMAAGAWVPSQNFHVADRAGRIGWTLIGPLPARRGFDGSTPRSWAAGDIGWDGHLAPVEHPRLADPAAGRLWTANNRVGGPALLARVGDGGFEAGARARQIRDGLLALERAGERDMLDLQLDDRALFLERWRTLLLDTLTPEALAADERRAELRRVATETWTGRASVDSAAFRIVHAFRLFVIDGTMEALTAACRAADERFRHASLRQLEGPVWRLVVERPEHLHDPRFASWAEQLLAAADAILEQLPEDGALADWTWGRRNTVRVGHPLSLALPRLSRWIDLPPEPLPGASAMPRVQGARFGASMRLVVSPGHEELGLFHMPGGQSGHPLSPHYDKGHTAWARGEPTPLLPGPPAHSLTLHP